MPLHLHTKISRLSVFAAVLAASAVVASSASAMPRRDVPTHAKVSHRSPARIDAAHHAATMRAIGAKRTARACS